MRRFLKSLMSGVSLAVLLAAPAAASTVRANPEPAGTAVKLVDSVGETNRLRMSVPREARKIRFRDARAPIEPVGQLCNEIEGPGSRVACELDGELFFEVDVEAGEGDDRITSEIAHRYGPEKVSFVRLQGGPGDDSIDAGAAEDTIVPGTGNDRVVAGTGYDFIAAGPDPDGPDFYDAGRQGGTISYVDRDEPVRVDLDGVANDGADGEGDDLVRTFGATGGSAGDRLFGDRHRNYLFGGDGPDRLRGRGDRDALVGEVGADRIFAGPGDDWVLDRGNAGIDVIDCGPGKDLYEADARDIVTRCEVPLFGPKAEQRSRAAAAKR